MSASAQPDLEIIEVDDERTALAAEAIHLIEQAFPPRDRQSAEELRFEIAEKRNGLIAPFGFHLLVARDPTAVLGVALGVYLAGVNAGFIHYLAVSSSHRGGGIGRMLRPALIDCFLADARDAGFDALNWVLGEVRIDNPWIRKLVAARGAIPCDLTYYHPGMRPDTGATAYVLYRQPVGDAREELPAQLVRRVLYAIYRRAYRVRYPLQHAGFAAMIEQLEGATMVGMHPAFR